MATETRSNLRKGWRGTWQQKPIDVAFGEGFGSTFNFSSSGSMTDDMDGGIITNAGATAAVTITAIDAVPGRSFQVTRREYYPVTITPASGDTIKGTAGSLLIVNSFTTILVCYEDGEWEVALRDADETFIDVQACGAKGDGATDDVGAFRIAYGLLGNPRQTVIIPATSAAYYVSGDFFDAVTSAATGNLGQTIVQGVIKTAVQLKVPNQHVVRGTGRRLNNTVAGGSIQTHATFPDDGTFMVRLGRAANEIIHGTRLEDIHLGCTGGQTTAGAVYGDCLQEQSGLRNVIAQGFNKGVYFRYGSAAGSDHSANFCVEDCEVYLEKDATGDAFHIWNGGGCTTVRRCTGLTNGTTGSFASNAFVFSGTNILAQGLHGEYCKAVVALGVSVSGYSGNAETEGILIDDVTVTHPPTNVSAEAVSSCPHMVHIISNTANVVSGIQIRNMRITNRADLIVKDEGDSTLGRPAINLTAAVYPAVSQYLIGDAYSGSAVAPLTKTTAHNGTRNVALGDNTHNLDPTFAGWMRFSVSTSVSAATLTGIDDGYLGRYIRLTNLGPSSLTIAHQNTGSSAENRFATFTGADFTLSVSANAVAEYGVGPSVQRWYVYRT